MSDEFLDIYREYDRRISMNESPDFVGVKDRGRLAAFGDNDAIPFGEYNGDMWVGKPGSTHYDIGLDIRDEYDIDARIERKDFQYPGRLWYNKKIISFWEYPPRNKLKQVINDINVAMSRAGLRAKITPDWRIDIPSDPAADRLKPVGYDSSTKWVRDTDYSYSYLYSIKNVLAGKELKGIGKAWRDMGIDMDTGQAHIDSPVKKKLDNLSKRDEKILWDYFKRLGNKDWSPADRALHNYMKSKLR